MSATTQADGTAMTNTKLERKGAVAILTISRPEKHNALNRETLSEIEATMLELARDEAVRALIITGAGEKAFVSGADINELAVLDARGAREISAFGQRVFNHIAQFKQPVIAAVNGWALGGGCELALACHMRFCSDNAKFGLPEVSLGIIPGYGGTQRLSRLVGLGRAVELVASGRTVDAHEALRIGLVQHVTSPAELFPNTLALAEKIAGNAPLAVSAALESMVRGQELALSDGLALESTMFGILGASEDMHEGLKAFLEKRKATFTGR
jgi:enoyl-CoA hydratase